MKIKLSPAQTQPITARVSLDGRRKSFKVFVPNVIYEVVDEAWEDLRKYKVSIRKNNPRLQEFIDMGLDYIEKQGGCTPCMKKKKLNPEDYKIYEFNAFVQV